ncbi:MAG TPA: MFS transporter [Rhodospirillaceae bacterium]|nr:MFS transporter [Candidatus Neomarinimicrobiota bacterium]HCX14476.1 MFS transporter [Rhodospirillaceae bacterium]
MSENSALIHNWSKALTVYTDRRLIIVLLMGFASGLPFLLTAATLSAWLSQAGVTKTLIGFMSWASSVYALKFLWSPIIDKVRLPGAAHLFGKRRAWMLAAQLLCMVAMIGLGSSDPTSNLTMTIIWTVLLAISSATQDIVVDAYRIEILEEPQFGAGAAMTTFGYRIAVIASGGGALLLADSFGWLFSYTTMAVLMLVGVVTVLLSPEPKLSSEPMVEESYGAWIRSAVVEPFTEFLSRPGAFTILAFIMLYKYGDALWASMANPFYLELGFSLGEIGTVVKTYGVFMTILGSFVGGVLVMRYGIHRTLLWGGLAMGLSNLLLAVLAAIGPSITGLAFVISIENFSNGVGSVAFIAFMSSLCNLAYTATQYALMTSFMAFTRTILASGGGWLADHVDWVTFFIITTFAAIPGLALLLWMMHRFPERRG